MINNESTKAMTTEVDENTYIIGEHLVNVGVDGDALVAWGSFETIPVAQGLEGIVNELHGVALCTRAERVSMCGTIHSKLPTR